MVTPYDPRRAYCEICWLDGWYKYRTDEIATFYKLKEEFSFCRIYFGQASYFCSEAHRQHYLAVVGKHVETLQTEIIGKIARDIHLYDISNLPQDLKENITWLAEISRSKYRCPTTK